MYFENLVSVQRYVSSGDSSGTILIMAWYDFAEYWFLKKDNLSWGLVVPPDVLGVKAVALG